MCQVTGSSSSERDSMLVTSVPDPALKRWCQDHTVGEEGEESVAGEEEHVGAIFKCGWGVSLVSIFSLVDR